MTHYKHPRENLVSAPQLKERGWTEAGIRKFLGTADDQRKNPHNAAKKAPPMRFWLAVRADQIERTQEWKDWAEKSQHRRLMAQARAAAAPPRPKIEAPWLKAKWRERIKDAIYTQGQGPKPFTVSSLTWRWMTDPTFPRGGKVRRYLDLLVAQGILRVVRAGAAGGGEGGIQRQLALSHEEVLRLTRERKEGRAS